MTDITYSDLTDVDPLNFVLLTLIDCRLSDSWNVSL